ncbi:hypothetical protein ACTMU2_34105 [Cupriavidus basilensis]
MNVRRAGPTSWGLSPLPAQCPHGPPSLPPGAITALLHAYIAWRLLPDLPVPMLVKALGIVWLAVSCALLPRRPAGGAV